MKKRFGILVLALIISAIAKHIAVAHPASGIVVNAKGEVMRLRFSVVLAFSVATCTQAQDKTLVLFEKETSLKGWTFRGGEKAAPRSKWTAMWRSQESNAADSPRRCGNIEGITYRNSCPSQKLSARLTRKPTAWSC